VDHRVLAPLCPSARRYADERLLARTIAEAPVGVLAGDDPVGVVQQALEPLVRPGTDPTGKVVTCMLAPVDVDLSTGRPGVRGEFDQALGLAVQEAELEGSVLARWKGAGERATVGESHPHR
jgi:hypothetical protein